LYVEFGKKNVYTLEEEEEENARDVSIFKFKDQT